MSDGESVVISRKDFESLKASIDQNSRGLAQLVDIVGKLHVKMDQGFSDLREEMRAGDEALRAEMRAGDEAIREEMRRGFAGHGQRIELLTSEQRLLRKEFGQLATACSQVIEQARVEGRNAGRDAAWEWIAVADGRIQNLETRLSRLEENRLFVEDPAADA